MIRPHLASQSREYDILYSRKQAAAAAEEKSDTGLLVARLTGCHQNGLEAFSYFSASVAIGIVSKLGESSLALPAGRVRLMHAYSI